MLLRYCAGSHHEVSGELSKNTCCYTGTQPQYKKHSLNLQRPVFIAFFYLMRYILSTLSMCLTNEPTNLRGGLSAITRRGCKILGLGSIILSVLHQKELLKIHVLKKF
jgi:hypothetical protein